MTEEHQSVAKEPSAGYEQELTWAFELRPENLARLGALLGEFSGAAVTFGVTTSDHYTELMSIERLLQYENTAERAILVLSALTEGADGQEATVTWSAASAEDNVAIKIQGERRDVEQLRQDLLALREATRPLHGWLTERKWAWFVVASAVFCASLYVADQWGAGDGTVLVGFLGVGLVYAVQHFIFPIGAFLIGAGARRAEKARWLRVAVLVPLLVGLLASTVFTALGGPE